MERLTKWLNDKKNLCIKKCEKECVEKYTECHKCEPFKDVMKRLAEYEDAEEQGLFLRLPCKVGDTVYSVVKDGLQIIELEFSLDFYARRKRDFGKTVFLTKEEAEHALKQIGE